MYIRLEKLSILGIFLPFYTIGTGILTSTFMKATSSYEIFLFRDFKTTKLKSGEVGTMNL
jgi:hypothetical protein